MRGPPGNSHSFRVLKVTSFRVRGRGALGVLGLNIFLGRGLKFSTLGCLKHHVKAVSRLTRKATVVTPDS